MIRTIRAMLIAAVLLLPALIPARVWAQVNPDYVVGTWYTEEDKATVEIYKEGDRYFGKITALKEPLRDGKPKVDKNNPKEELRTQPIIGLVFLKSFKFDGDDEWKEGTIYDAESGKEYTSKMYIEKDNKLKVKGYILGMPFLGRSQIWTRTKKS